jgi:hypothetical protein
VKLPRYDFEDGDFWGNEILTDLEFHASAWIYWNTILDEKGGPWLVSPVPVVIADRKTKPRSRMGFISSFEQHNNSRRIGSFQQDGV